VQKPAFRQSTQRAPDQATTDSRAKLRQRQTANPLLGSLYPIIPTACAIYSYYSLNWTPFIPEPRLDFHLSSTTFTSPKPLPSPTRPPSQPSRDSSFNFVMRFIHVVISDMQFQKVAPQSDPSHSPSATPIPHRNAYSPS
jgi:hypothetical protein